MLVSIFCVPAPSPPHATPRGIVRNRLLQGNETGRVGGTDTGTTVLDGAVRDGELGEVVADHLGLDLDRVEDLAVVDADDGADHLGDDDHVTEVGLHDGRLFVGERLLLRLAELLDETHGLALETALEPPAGTSMDNLRRGKGCFEDGSYGSDLARSYLNELR